jgi:hypothetical protein
VLLNREPSARTEPPAEGFPILARALTVTQLILNTHAAAAARAEARPYKKRRRKVTIWRLLQLTGAGCLVVVVLTHVAEAFGLFPVMGWGLPSSPGHYLDLVSAVLGCTLLPLGFLGNAMARRKKMKDRLGR